MVSFYQIRKEQIAYHRDIVLDLEILIMMNYGYLFVCNTCWPAASVDLSVLFWVTAWLGWSGHREHHLGGSGVRLGRP
jgi:hypothetical protein